MGEAPRKQEEEEVHRRRLRPGFNVYLFAAINKVSQIGKGWGRSNFRCVVDVVSLNVSFDAGWTCLHVNSEGGGGGGGGG